MNSTAIVLSTKTNVFEIWSVPHPFIVNISQVSDENQEDF